MLSHETGLDLAEHGISMLSKMSVTRCADEASDGKLVKKKRQTTRSAVSGKIGKPDFQKQEEGRG